MSNPGSDSLYDIAIIGMAGRFPGASDLGHFWENLCSGAESITFFSDQELAESGIDSRLMDDPNYVKAGVVLSDVECFDAHFFGINPQEAAMMDPQQRIFLECAWRALENTGYDVERYDGSVGVYAGVSASTYLLRNLYTAPAESGHDNLFQAMIGNDKDYLATQISYRLNLQGPSITVQTACSTSLVAVHLACQSLLDKECDMALAGGIAVKVPQVAGYLYEPGGILSPDGHCRPFDAQARGTIVGHGVGIVVLKRLADALEDRDTVLAVIKGSAINNDGARKIGYTAPSEEGQVEVITEALAVANVPPETITYIETHGTGTELGDPIEIAALTRVFRASTPAKGFCAIGSIKSNIGHLDTAAGIAGLIKTVLALQHKHLPPSLNFAEPNPKIDFAGSPFYVNTRLQEWKTGKHPRRAGVSSFGIGGTNAHVVLEEAPSSLPVDPGREEHLLILSAKTAEALEEATTNLAAYLRQNPDANLADVAYTLQMGRRSFEYRRVLACKDATDAVMALESLDATRVLTAFEEDWRRPLFFLFPGQGAQYVLMGRGLYESEPLFKSTVDHCVTLLKSYLNFNLLDVLYPAPGGEAAATQQLDQTAITQPALFVIEYALAKLWLAWGLQPRAMIGHSVGEYVAACLAGVFTLEDALKLVAQRGRLIQQLPGGSMLSVSLTEAEARLFLNEQLSLAAVNAPGFCVISGPNAAIDALQAQLESQGISHRRLHTSHAFHSAMMEPILGEFAACAGRVTLNPPTMPFVSNVTGAWITADEATDPRYWARHLRQTVKFADGLKLLLAESAPVLLEVGPGRTLSTFAQQQQAQAVFTSLRHSNDKQADFPFLLTSLGQLWLSGLEVNWRALYEGERRRRVPLPAYPFARERYWIEPARRVGEAVIPPFLAKESDVARWFYVPSWKRLSLPDSWASHWADRRSCWLVFCDEHGLGIQLAKRLEQASQDVITVTAGKEFYQDSQDAYTLDPQESASYDALINDLCKSDRLPETIIHLWNVTSPDPAQPTPESFDAAQSLGFYSLIFLAQALGKQNVTSSIRIGVISNDLQDVMGDEPLRPEKATLLGPCKVIPQEYANVTCCSIDVAVPEARVWPDETVEDLIKELAAKSPDTVLAFRGKHRWVQTFEPLCLDGAPRQPAMLRQGGVYLITGGLGRIGRTLSRYLAKTVQAKLALISRSGLPPRDDWAHWLATLETDSIGDKIRFVQELEAQGAEVLVIAADVSDRNQMQAAVAQTLRQFGALHGVIHAAGLVGENMLTPVQGATRDMCEAHSHSKVHGVLALAQVLCDHPLDFCLLFSSLSSVLGGLGIAAYAASNCFLDAFAQQRRQAQLAPWLSVSWDAWRFADEDSAKVGRSVTKLSMLPEEGVRTFEQALNVKGEPWLVVSTGDLQARWKEWVAQRATDADKRAAAMPITRHARPPLRNQYVAPSDEIEAKLADIWEELLGIDQVGIHDNFFDLGGHSLLVVQMQAKLQAHFGCNLPAALLFQYPTVHDLAQYLSQTQTPQPTLMPTQERVDRYRAALKRQQKGHQPGGPGRPNSPEEARD